jgi:hypothetical protein
MRYGVWVDHRKAILVKLDGDEATTETVRSEVGPRVRRAGGTAGATATAMGRGRAGGRTGGPQQAVAEDRLDRKHEQSLARYYRKLADRLDDAEAIFVFGPGEAPGELARSLEAKLGSRMVGVEAADKMTTPRIVAHVREIFGKELPRGRRRQRDLV